MDRRITQTDLVVLRQSLGMSSQLPPVQVRRLLDELERLLALEADIEAVVLKLRRPFGDVRVALNELSKLAVRDALGPVP